MLAQDNLLQARVHAQQYYKLYHRIGLVAFSDAGVTPEHLFTLAQDNLLQARAHAQALSAAASFRLTTSQVRARPLGSVSIRMKALHAAYGLRRWCKRSIPLKKCIGVC